MEKYTIIVAGGSGSRMQMNIPKQFIVLKGKPVLIHTMEAFKKYDKNCKIILVLPEEHFPLWEELYRKYECKIEYHLVRGGDTRFHSVKNGLKLIEGEAIIAIHDGVRPLVSTETIKECYEVAKQKGNAIPVVLVNDSMRKVDLDGNHSVTRKQYRLVQTPQCFKSDIILKAYQKKYSEDFTDDASVVEAVGVKINLVQGNPENIKITTQTDLIIAEALLNC